MRSSHLQASIASSPFRANAVIFDSLLSQVESLARVSDAGFFIGEA